MMRAGARALDNLALSARGRTCPVIVPFSITGQTLCVCIQY